MKISEYKNEKALEVLADLIEPSAEIFTDKGLLALIRGDGEEEGGNKKMKAISYALKHHPHEVIQILAILEGIPVEKYECKLFTLPMKILEILNDDDLISFFSSQVPTLEQTFSGNATENTEVNEQSEDSLNITQPNSTDTQEG